MMFSEVVDDLLCLDRDSLSTEAQPDGGERLTLGSLTEDDLDDRILSFLLSDNSVSKSSS